MARKANLKKGMKGPQKMRYQMGGKELFKMHLL